MQLSDLGSRIKLARKQQGLTLEVLSEKLGISRNFLWEIEAGRKAPALNTLYNLGLVLDISIDYLLGFTSEKKNIQNHAQPTKREAEITKILNMLNEYEISELSLISDVIADFSKYLEQK